MSTWAWVAVIFLGACASAAVTYAMARVRFEKSSEARGQALAEARAALESERNSFKETARAIEETARRTAMDDFLKDVRIEERRYFREHRG